MDLFTEQALKNIRGLQTGWLEIGKSNHPLLLFLHGYPDSPLVWENQIHHFSPHFHVVCPFARGAGPSEPAAEIRRNGLSSQSLDCLQMLKELDPGMRRDIYLVGHDLGAVHAWNLAPYLGKRLKRMVIFNGLHIKQFLRKLKRPSQHIRSSYMYAMQIPWVPEILAARFPKTLASLAYRLGGLSKKDRPESSPDGIGAPLNQYRAFLRGSLKSLRAPTQRVEAPVLIVWGERDRFVNPITTDEFEPFATNVTFRIVPRGHWHFRENPDETHRLLDDFFEIKNA